MVYAFDKFRPCIILSRTIVFTDHSALKYLFSKYDVKPRLIWWVLLLQEFDIEIKDKMGMENMVADHLSHLENPKLEQLKEGKVDDNSHEEYLIVIAGEEPWYADIVNYLSRKYLPKGLSHQQNKKLFSQLNIISRISHTCLEVTLMG